MGTKTEHSFWLYFSKRMHKIDKLIPQLAAENPKKLHLFRIEVKRLFSLLDMLAFRMDNELAFTSIKNLIWPLFKSVGRVRSTQIYVKLLDELGIAHIQMFSDFLLKKNEIACVKLKKVTNRLIYSSQYPLTEVVFDILQPVDEEGLPFCYVQKMQSEMSILNESDMIPANVLQWHTIRKSMKCLLYLENLEHLFYDVIQISSNYHKQLKQKEKMLGKWHDKKMLQNELNKFLNINPELMVNVNMIRLRYKLKSELADLEQKLISRRNKKFISAN